MKQMNFGCGLLIGMAALTVQAQDVSVRAKEMQRTFEEAPVEKKELARASIVGGSLVSLEFGRANWVAIEKSVQRDGLEGRVLGSVLVGAVGAGGNPFSAAGAGASANAFVVLTIASMLLGDGKPKGRVDSWGTYYIDKNEGVNSPGKEEEVDGTVLSRIESGLQEFAKETRAEFACVKGCETWKSGEYRILSLNRPHQESGEYMPCKLFVEIKNAGARSASSNNKHPLNALLTDKDFFWTPVGGNKGFELRVFEHDGGACEGDAFRNGLGTVYAERIFKLVATNGIRVGGVSENGRGYIFTEAGMFVTNGLTKETFAPFKVKE